MTPAFEPPLDIDELARCLPTPMTITGRLAPGGQGSLFLIEGAKGTEVLKIYRSSHRVRAERECDLLTSLVSQYLVRLVRWGSLGIRGEECIFTVTELVDGSALDAILKERVVSEAEARRLGSCVVRAIDQLWTHGRIVHRDIKPANIILRPDGAAVLLDLGIAKYNDLISYTTWGVVWGTPGYMSPEQARGRRGLTFKSDLFALGVVLYEAASGKHPYMCRQELISNVVPPPLDRVADMSASLSRLTMQLLKIDPLDRPSTCEAVIRTLEGE